jgi:hypothetical protein
MLTLNQRTRLLDRILNDDRFDSFTLTAYGKSMRPFVKDGTRIKFQKIGPGRMPEIGDVAAIRYRNGILVHRILLIRWRKDGLEYFTKGDRRLVADGWIPHSRIAAVADFPIAGRILGEAMAVYSLFLAAVGKILRRDRRKR